MRINSMPGEICAKNKSIEYMVVVHNGKKKSFKHLALIKKKKDC